MSTRAIILAGVPVPSRPWPRHVLSPPNWDRLATLADPTLRLAALWADTQQVHALFEPNAPLGAAPGEPLVASVPVEQGRYTALSPLHPHAALFERIVQDLFGHRAEGGLDDRAWLDHDRWPQRRPLSPRPLVAGAAAAPPELREPAERPDHQPALHQLGLGPAGDVPGGPAHLRLTLAGERIASAEWRMGYCYRGAAAMMRGKSPRAAARYAARLAGDATVAHGAAFARAAEAATGLPPPPRAAALITAALALERVAIGWSRLAAIAADAASPRLANACGLWREQLLRAAAAAFGHRLMMDLVLPGGVTADPSPAQRASLQASLAALADAWRRRPPAPRLNDPAASRLAALLAGIGPDLAAAAATLASLPDGPVMASLPEEVARRSGEGFGEALASRGRTLHWLRIEHGLITAASPFDPGLFSLATVEQALTGQLVDDLKHTVNLHGVWSAGLDA